MKKNLKIEVKYRDGTKECFNCRDYPSPYGNFMVFNLNEPFTERLISVEKIDEIKQQLISQ